MTVPDPGAYPTYALTYRDGLWRVVDDVSGVEASTYSLADALAVLRRRAESDLYAARRVGGPQVKRCLTCDAPAWSNRATRCLACGTPYPQHDPTTGGRTHADP